jgi:hypothetical protein
MSLKKSVEQEIRSQQILYLIKVKHLVSNGNKSVVQVELAEARENSIRDLISGASVAGRSILPLMMNTMERFAEEDK